VFRPAPLCRAKWNFCKTLVSADIKALVCYVDVVLGLNVALIILLCFSDQKSSLMSKVTEAKLFRSAHSPLNISNIETVSVTTVK